MGHSERNQIPLRPESKFTSIYQNLAGLANLIDMKTELKKHLIHIADRLTPDSTLEEVYEQQALLADIEISEEQERNGEVLTQAEVVQQQSEEWLK